MNALIDKLLKSRQGTIFWSGYLSSSALSTAVSALALFYFDREKYAQQIQAGVKWLIENINDDGGWGDTDKSFSNISTTLLCLACLETITPADSRQSKTIISCKAYIAQYCGSLASEDIVSAVYSRYEDDKTFSVPILSVCALAGILGESKKAWKYVFRLPFELSILPHRFYSILGLPVVSYALPALIALGILIHKNRPSFNPVTRIVRSLSKQRALKKLAAIQPVNGGFLEASPLTSFVCISLMNSGFRNSKIVDRCISFIDSSQRPDGSWAIDTDLSVWLTTLSVNALADSGSLFSLETGERERLSGWLCDNQYSNIHPYTQSSPGGWGWSDKPGAVPDADDTAGAVLALCNLVGAGVELNDRVKESIIKGSLWLAGIQNKDGGIPTFCKGWGKLPFDRSCNDITAHAVAAWSAALKTIDDRSLNDRLLQAIEKALLYLRYSQHFDGWWKPLWFGCQYIEDDSNPVYGSARVVSGIADVPEQFVYLARPMIEKAVQWLVSVQGPSGGFSGGISQMIVEADKDLCSAEETALVINALKKAIAQLPNEKQKKTDK